MNIPQHHFVERNIFKKSFERCDKEIVSEFQFIWTVLSIQMSSKIWKQQQKFEKFETIEQDDRLECVDCTVNQE